MYFLSDDYFMFTNSVDPDEMQHYAALHLGLHCLQKYSLRGFPNTTGVKVSKNGLIFIVYITQEVSLKR